MCDDGDAAILQRQANALDRARQGAASAASAAAAAATASSSSAGGTASSSSSAAAGLAARAASASPPAAAGAGCAADTSAASIYGAAGDEDGGGKKRYFSIEGNEGVADAIARVSTAQCLLTTTAGKAGEYTTADAATKCGFSEDADFLAVVDVIKANPRSNFRVLFVEYVNYLAKVHACAGEPSGSGWAGERTAHYRSLPTTRLETRSTACEPKSLYV